MELHADFEENLPRPEYEGQRLLVGGMILFVAKKDSDKLDWATEGHNCIGMAWQKYLDLRLVNTPIVFDIPLKKEHKK